MVDYDKTSIVVSSGQIVSGQNFLYYKRIENQLLKDKNLLEIVFVHSILGMHDTYLEFASSLLDTDNSLIGSVVLFDLRGHGLSSGPRVHVSSCKEYFDDIDSIANWLDEKSSVRKRVLYSFGTGAIVCLNYFVNYGSRANFIGCILQRPMFIGETLVSKPFKRLGKIDFVKHLRVAPVAYCSDTSCFSHKRMSIGLYQELERFTKDAIENCFYVDKPLLLICDEQDEVSSCCDKIIRRVDKKFLTLSKDILKKEIYHWLVKLMGV